MLCHRSYDKAPNQTILRSIPCPVQGATFGFFHDILVTENYYVAVENPISMNFGRLLTGYTLGRACLAECLEFDRRPTRIHLIPRPGASGAHCHVMSHNYIYIFMVMFMFIFILYIYIYICFPELAHSTLLSSTCSQLSKVVGQRGSQPLHRRITGAGPWNASWPSLFLYSG